MQTCLMWVSVGDFPWTDTDRTQWWVFLLEQFYIFNLIKPTTNKHYAFQLWLRRELWAHRWSLCSGQARYSHVALHAARPLLALFALFARLSSAALGSFISRLAWWTCLRWTAAGRRGHLLNTVTNINMCFIVCFWFDTQNTQIFIFKKSVS